MFAFPLVASVYNQSNRRGLLPTERQVISSERNGRQTFPVVQVALNGIVRILCVRLVQLLLQPRCRLRLVLLLFLPPGQVLLKCRHVGRIVRPGVPCVDGLADGPTGHNDRVADNPDTIAALWQFELSLHRAMRLLHRSGRTFRVERVPLCYMTEYAHCSTETRKIVKGEERTVHFLDDRGRVRQTGFAHHKADCCEICLLDPVCAGLDGVEHGMDPVELAPVFVPAASVVARVLGVPVSSVPTAWLERIAARQATLPKTEGR